MNQFVTMLQKKFAQLTTKEFVKQKPFMQMNHMKVKDVLMKNKKNARKSGSPWDILRYVCEFEQKYMQKIKAEVKPFEQKEIQAKFSKKYTQPK